MPICNVVLCLYTKCTYVISNVRSNSYFVVEEILNFNQVDLVTEDVMILDTGETLFVWLGADSNKTEKEAVLVTSKDYLLSDPSQRNVDIPIIVVKQGFEPPHFTGYFGAWDPDIWPVSYLILNSFNILDSFRKIISLE